MFSAFQWTSAAFLLPCILSGDKLHLPPPAPWNQTASAVPPTLQQMVQDEFLVAAVTNYHMLGGLNQQKLILSGFWRPEI